MVALLVSNYGGNMSGLGIGFFFCSAEFRNQLAQRVGVGHTWKNQKAAGGFTHFCYLVARPSCPDAASPGAICSCWHISLARFTITATRFLAPRYVQGMLELGYAVIILPILGSDSVSQFPAGGFKRKRICSMAVSLRTTRTL